MIMENSKTAGILNAYTINFLGIKKMSFQRFPQVKIIAVLLLNVCRTVTKGYFPVYEAAR